MKNGLGMVLEMPDKYFSSIIDYRFLDDKESEN